MRQTADTLASISRRLESYSRAPISLLVSGRDGMLQRGVPGAAGHYLAVGRSAIDVIASGMVLAGRTSLRSVLDLPCGGGRVTRHLKAFLPDAELFIAELDRELQHFTAETFGAEPVAVDADFSSEPRRQFDLIWVGSLVTHFGATQFERAVRWFISALAPEGLLVLTTHGRRHVSRNMPRPENWAAAVTQFMETGFGYLETERMGGLSYGFSICSPAWLMRLIETDTQTRVVGFLEAAWDDHQDVLVLQKLP